MQHYRCACGKTRSLASIPPFPCEACPVPQKQEFFTRLRSAEAQKATTAFFEKRQAAADR